MAKVDPYTWNVAAPLAKRFTFSDELNPDKEINVSLRKLSAVRLAAAHERGREMQRQLECGELNIIAPRNDDQVVLSFDSAVACHILEIAQVDTDDPYSALDFAVFMAGSDELANQFGEAANWTIPGGEEKPPLGSGASSPPLVLPPDSPTTNPSSTTDDSSGASTSD